MKLHTTPDNRINFKKNPERVFSIEMLKKKALIELCNQFGLSSGGLRSDLIQRLYGHNINSFKWSKGIKTL